MKRLAQFFLVIILMSAVILAGIHFMTKSFEEFESACHGQCSTSRIAKERHDCKVRCDKLTVCPTYGAE